MRGDRLDSLPAVGVAGALVAVACCAGLPLIGAFLGGVTLAALLGVAGGAVLALGVVAAAVVVIDGRDVEPGAEERDDFGWKCRLYRVPSGLRGTPLDEWVIDALDRART